MTSALPVSSRRVPTRAAVLETLRGWIARLETAVVTERRDIIEVVLKDAVPEFGNGATLRKRVEAD